MELAATRFEVRVGTLVSAPLLAAFKLSLGRIAPPSERIHRLRLPADQDVPSLVRRLTERDIEIVEIRRCPAPPRRAETEHRASSPDGVVLPFAARPRWCRRAFRGDSAG